MMNTARIYNEQDIDWGELSSIGIEKSFLHETGQFEALLCGETTEAMSFEITLLGIPIYMDASLRLEAAPDGEILIHIEGVQFNNIPD